MTNEEFEAELEKLGVARVKENIATQAYLGPWKSLAQGWVVRKEALSSEEHLSLARQARKDAQRANWIALGAVIIALASMIVAVFK